MQAIHSVLPKGFSLTPANAWGFEYRPVNSGALSTDGNATLAPEHEETDVVRLVDIVAGYVDSRSERLGVWIEDECIARETLHSGDATSESEASGHTAYTNTFDWSETLEWEEVDAADTLVAMSKDHTETSLNQIEGVQFVAESHQSPAAAQASSAAGPHVWLKDVSTGGTATRRSAESSDLKTNGRSNGPQRLRIRPSIASLLNEEPKASDEIPKSLDVRGTKRSASESLAHPRTKKECGREASEIN